MNIEEFAKINNINVLVFGDFMVDEYISGKVNRISPEAPVPVLEVVSKNKKLGGAGNVVKNLMSIGANVKILGVIGNDDYGKWMIETFQNMGINTNHLLLDNEFNTIVKTRITSKGQQFIRCDEEKIKNIDDNIASKLFGDINGLFNNVDILIISDYGKGAVSEKFSQLLINEANNKNIATVVDPKGVNYSKYKNATICTPNLNELSIATNNKITSEEDIIKCSEKVINDNKLEYLLVTRSEDGMSLISANKNKFDIKAKAKEVVDVTGAGDTVVAILSTMIAIGLPLEKCCEISNIAASIVVTKFGAATVTLNELVNAIINNQKYKYINLNTATYIVNYLKEQKKKIVFTNGCFDMLHAGHLSSFINAKKFGDILIVAVNSDESVKKNKGDLRPIIDEENRIKLLCAIEYIDYIILMNDDNPSKLINTIKPDISIKGEDWKGKDIPEKSIVENYGGRMEFVPLSKGLSTTEIINKIIKVYDEK